MAATTLLGAEGAQGARAGTQRELSFSQCDGTVFFGLGHGQEALGS